MKNFCYSALLCLLFMSLGFTSVTKAQAYNGSLTLKTQAEVDNFPYTTITGYLTIQEQVPGSITNLNGLLKIKWAAGIELKNLTAISDLSGLANLTHLGSLSIEGLPSLTKISPLPPVSIGGLSLRFNDALTDISALLPVMNDTAGIEISNNAVLTNLDGLSSIKVSGSVGIRNNPALQNLNGLSGFQEVWDWFIITGNPALVNISGLQNLKTVSRHLEISDNASLPNLDGLSGLNKVPRLYITNNDLLENIDGLHNLNYINYIDITGNASLLNTEGLKGITKLPGIDRFGEVNILNNPALLNVNGFSNVSSITCAINIKNNSSLTEFCGFYKVLNKPYVYNFDYLHIEGNAVNPTNSEIIEAGTCYPVIYDGDLFLDTQTKVDTFHYTRVTGNIEIKGSSGDNSLVNLNGLLELESIGGSLMLNGPHVIKDIYGLRHLKEVGGNVVITQTNWLKSLIGLNGLVSLGGNLTIENNEILGEYCGLYPLLTGGYSGQISVTGNFLNPTKEEIIAGGGCPPIFNGLLEISTQAQIDSFNYGIVNGTLSINGITSTEITNLRGLSGLRLAEKLHIYDNDKLISLEGLDSLLYLSNLEIEANDLLLDVYSINNILLLEKLKFSFNRALVFFNTLNKITRLYGFSVEGNKSMQSIDGFNGLKTFKGESEIVDNEKLVSIPGFNGVIHFDYLDIEDNPILKHIGGFSAVDSITSRLSLENNPLLTNLVGFSKLRTAGLVQLHGLGITNTDGLKNLKRIYDGISIDRNSNLISLRGLSDIEYATGTHWITRNTKLTEFCGAYNLVRFSNEVNISENAANPTRAEIIAAGPCYYEKSFISVMLGKNVTPPVLTDGSGGGMFVLNSTQDTMHYWIRLCELKCPMTYVYLRNGAAGATGPVVKDITGQMIVTPGSNDAYGHGMWTSSDSLPLTTELVSQLMAGNIYVEVRTTGYPSGEIRGQITNNQPVHLFANLEGSQVVPPFNTAGSAEGSFILSGDGTSLDFILSENLDGDKRKITGSFHTGKVGESGPVVSPNIGNWGIINDTSTGNWKNTGYNPLTPALVADLLGCYIYAELDQSDYEGTYITETVRGQVYKTVEQPMDYMTLYAAQNNDNPESYSKLSYYSLSEGKPFLSDEGNITGYDGQKNIVDMTIDIGGNVYLLNNSYTSMLYRIRPEQFDLDASTVVLAKQMGRLRTFPDDNYIWMTNIQYIKGRLYGFNNLNNKLYSINPYNAHVVEIVELSSIGAGTAGFALGADGYVYLLKNIDEKRSEIWKFNKFPSSELTLVTEIPSLGKLNTLSAHPNGNLYSVCSENLYEINLTNKTIGLLKDHKITASAMDFDFFTEQHASATGTIGFTNLDGVTDVENFTGLPTKYELSQNYPNPFNPNTTINYALPEASFVKLVVYNSLGEVVKTLVNDNRSAGYYETVFDAKGLASGMYIYRLEAGSFVSTAKMIMIK